MTEAHNTATTNGVASRARPDLTSPLSSPTATISEMQTRAIRRGVPRLKATCRAPPVAAALRATFVAAGAVLARVADGCARTAATTRVHATATTSGTGAIRLFETSAAANANVTATGATATFVDDGIRPPRWAAAPDRHQDAVIRPVEASHQRVVSPFAETLCVARLLAALRAATGILATCTPLCATHAIF